MKRFVAIMVVFVAAGPISAQAKYGDAVNNIEAAVRYHVQTKKLAAVSVVLLEDQKVISAFGNQSDPRVLLSNGDTIFRVGSISKTFTALAIMQAVERGELSLDLPITKYVPEFKMEGAEQITLRQLLAHRSGLPRETPIGSYVDRTSPNLRDCILSLNKGKLGHAPAKQTNYSNAGVTLAAHALELQSGRPFSEILQERVFGPLKMTNSGFRVTDSKKKIAQGSMWTVFEKDSPAPLFDIAGVPAGNMYSSASDLAKFMSMVFAGGEKVVHPDSLTEVMKPQFPDNTGRGQFGLGLIQQELNGQRMIGHGGVAYGFGGQFWILPEQKLGVVVLIAKDFTQGLADGLAQFALGQLLAAKQGKPADKFTEFKSIPQEVGEAWAGRYSVLHPTAADIELEWTGKHLRLWAMRGGSPMELSLAGDDFVTDSCVNVGTRVARLGKDQLQFGERTFRRLAAKKPEPVSEKWSRFIGEYGPEHLKLIIFEREGSLFAMLGGTLFYPLAEKSAQEFQFPTYGLLAHARLTFESNDGKKFHQLNIDGVPFIRNWFPEDGGKSFHIEPERPVDVLMKEARAATPPKHQGEFNTPDLVDLSALDPTIKFDIRYASDDNFLGVPVYPIAKASLQRPAAEALLKAHKSLEKDGFGLLIHDAYRPWHVTKVFWDATPAKNKIFVADPSTGSRHNRGCAVDLTLYDRATGQPIIMPGGYDEFSDRSYPLYPGGTSLQRWHRDRLKRAMHEQGFTVFEAEWWHFDYREWKKYPVLNVPLDGEKK